MLGAENEEEFERMLSAIHRHPRMVEYEREHLAEVERRLGTTRARRMVLGVSNTFPNFTCHIFNRLVRVWQPRGPFQTEVWAFVALDKAMPQELKDIVRVLSQQIFNPSGMFEQDDMDNWNGCTQSGRSLTARKYPQNIAMGIGHEITRDDMPGVLVASSINEQTQRGLYAGWQDFMNAESWKDITLAPKTAKYEGTATMKG